MAGRSDRNDHASLAPDDAFELLGNETRMDILRALWDVYEPYGPETALPFSDLYDRVDVEDTGNFNYHLGKLTDHFVRETDTGYELAPPGAHVVNAVASGTATEDPILEPAPVDVTCPQCESQVEVSYDEGIVWVRCVECAGYWIQRGGEILEFELPPEGLRNRTPDEILDATLVYAIRRFQTLNDGVCPECGGIVDASLEACTDHDAADGICDACGVRFLGLVWYDCTSCKTALVSPSWAVVHHHPAVVAFYYDRGVELAHASWESVSRGFGWDEELHSMDPAELRITVSHEGEELALTLDETGTVVDVGR